MAYADAEFYRDVYQGTIIPPEEQERALVHASHQIDCLTYNRILAKRFDNLTPFQQEKVKMAVCVQADFTKQFGELLDLPLSGFSAGSISMSMGEKINGVVASGEAQRLLGQTGLTCRRL